MDQDGRIQIDTGRAKRLVHHLDEMVARGHVTEDEADRLRAADHDAFKEVVGDIRARHVAAALAQRVADGSLSRCEADSLLERVRQGEHSRALVEAVLGQPRGAGSRQAAAGSERSGQKDAST